MEKHKIYHIKNLDQEIKIKIEKNIMKILNNILKSNQNSNYNSIKINMIHNLYKISKKYKLEDLIKIFEKKYKKILEKRILYWSGNIINNNKFKKNILDTIKKNKINIDNYNIKNKFHITLFFLEKIINKKYNLL